MLYLVSSCNSQSKTSGSEIKKEKIFLQGAIMDSKTKEPIPFATYSLFSTDTGSVWNGSIRRGASDNLGNYKIDITSLTDSTDILVLRSKCIRYALGHIILKGNIKKSIVVNLELVEGNGDNYQYYQVDPKDSRLKLENSINKVRNPGN